ncbi:MAG: rod shape-determining protein MreC [Coriobacteriia bacterium]|nr:rod shape-determining protein MreC [Coriobacteriia bacterium]
MPPLKITPTEKRKRPYFWLIILVVLSLVLITAYAREDSGGPLHGLRVAVQTTIAPVGQAGKWVTTPLRSFAAWTAGLGVSRSELVNLRAQNAKLRAQIVELQEADHAASTQTALTDAAQTGGYKGVTANVIGLPVSQWERVIVVNAGSLKGIKDTMPVLGANGLLGQVIEVGPNYSKVRLITDQESGIASFLQNNRAQGITRGSLSGDLTMNFVSMEATVTAGDTVVSSGLGGVFPKGLIIGQVSKVSKEVNSLYKTIQVQPANDMAQIESVIILTNAPPDTNNLPKAVPTTTSAQGGN